MLRTFIFILILVIIKVILSLAPIRFLIYNRFMHVVILKVHNSEANATITLLNRVVTYQVMNLFTPANPFISRICHHYICFSEETIVKINYPAYFSKKYLLTKIQNTITYI